MDPITNDGIGMTLRYALWFSGTIASILVCFNMLRPKPDFRELAAEMRKSMEAWQEKMSSTLADYRIEQSVLKERVADHARRLGCIDLRCEEEKKLLRDQEGRLHERIDLMAKDLSGINKNVGAVESSLKGVGKQLDVISKKMMEP
jgi:hypothetical protein